MVNNPRIFHLGESLNKLPELRENNGKAKRKQSYSSAVTANYYESSTHKKPRETWLQGYACCKHSLFIVRQKITHIKSLSRRRIRDWFQFIVWLNNNHNIIFRISYKASSCEVVWKDQLKFSCSIDFHFYNIISHDILQIFKFLPFFQLSVRTISKYFLNTITSCWIISCISDYTLDNNYNSNSPTRQ